jgi:hypothetical protein
MSPKTPGGVTYAKTGGAGTHTYVVIHGGAAIGTVAKFQMGAGQFGSSWMATTRSGKKSTGFTSREQAAAWLLRQAA